MNAAATGKAVQRFWRSPFLHYRLPMLFARGIDFTFLVLVHFLNRRIPAGFAGGLGSRDFAGECKRESRAPNVSNECAFILNNIAQSLMGLATQLDLLADKIKN